MANRKWLAHKKDGDHKSPSFFTLFSKIRNFPVDNSLQKWYNDIRKPKEEQKNESIEKPKYRRNGETC